MIVQNNPILRETAHALIPLILLYAFYVQFHGHVGPGGGFQAGVIFSVAFVIYGLVYGFEHMHAVISERTAEVLACAGVLLYCGVGFATLLRGGSFLDYDWLGAATAGRTTHRHLSGRVRRCHDDCRHHRQHIFHGYPDTCMSLTDWLNGYHTYWFIVLLMVLGLYIVIAYGNLAKKLIGLNVFQGAVFALFIVFGNAENASPPIISDTVSVYANPLPHVLILTAIVVALSSTALGLALIIRIYRAWGTLEEEDLGR